MHSTKHCSTQRGGRWLRGKLAAAVSQPQQAHTLTYKKSPFPSPRAATDFEPSTTPPAPASVLKPSPPPPSPPAIPSLPMMPSTVSVAPAFTRFTAPSGMRTRSVRDAPGPPAAPVTP